MPAEDIQALYDMGVRDFGENRIPELERKAAGLPRDIIWHFIGPMQSNKIRKVAKMAQVIHSIESCEQIEKLERICGEEDKHPEFFLEVNVSGEASKGGLRGEELFEAGNLAAKCKNAHWCGLMTMVPIDADDEALEEIFSTLAELKKECEARFNVTLPELSMGMSGDFPIAVAQGATVVRIGSRIFEGVERS